MRPNHLVFTNINNRLSIINRGDRTRTCGLKVPNFARYQLCYTPYVSIIHFCAA